MHTFEGHCSRLPAPSVSIAPGAYVDGPVAHRCSGALGTRAPSVDWLNSSTCVYAGGKPLPQSAAQEFRISLMLVRKLFSSSCRERKHRLLKCSQSRKSRWKFTRNFAGKNPVRERGGAGAPFRQDDEGRVWGGGVPDPDYPRFGLQQGRGAWGVCW